MTVDLYDGWVTHARRSPAHRFTYKLLLPLVDPDSVGSDFDGTAGWGSGWWNPVRYSDDDYLSPAAARDLVGEATGEDTKGQVLQLAHLRSFGWCFNPIVLYFCHDRAGALTGTVATVTNTPWGERQNYVIPADGRLRASRDSHVSPFLPMGVDYAVRLRQEPDRIDLRIDVEKQGEAVLRTSMSLTRTDHDHAARAAAVFRPRFHSLRTSAAIYWQAAILKRKGARFHRHPARAGS